MSIFKPKDSKYWYVDIATASGGRIRRSTRTTNKKAAQEYHDRLKVELWEVERLGIKQKYTFEQAAVKMLELSADQSDYRTKLRHVQYWREIFGGRTICSLTNSEIIDNLPTHSKSTGKPTSNATKNRYIATIRRVYNVAYELGWVENKLRTTQFKERKVNVRWISKGQADILLMNIHNHWLKAVTEFALYTGCRMSEILDLRWSNVDLERSTAWIEAPNAKSERARSIPLNQEALSVLYRRKGIHQNYCFGRVHDRPASEIDRRMFDIAVKKSGIQPFTFHDLRHTWASWHAQAGTPLMVLKELGGWEKLEMVLKYAHLSTSHLAEYAGNVSDNNSRHKKSATSELRQSNALKLVS